MLRYFLGIIISLSAVDIYAAAEQTPDAAPRVIYHFGQKDQLFEDIEAGTITPAIWQHDIMGGQSRFGLKPYRRGLYGSTSPGIAVAYGDDEILDGKMPWFMKIEIKRACRQKKSVIRGFESLPRDERFLSAWNGLSAAKHFVGINDFARKCLTSGESGLSLYNGDGPSSGTGETPCEQVIHEFMNARSIKLVGDDAWDESWFIRDRSCISAIKGTPIEVLSDMTQPDFWKSKSLGDTISDNPDGITIGSSYLVILLDSLSAVRTLDSVTALQKVVWQSDFADDQVDPPVLWAKLSATSAIAAWSRCQKRNDLSAFRNFVSNQLSKLFEQMTKAGPSPRLVFQNWALNLKKGSVRLCR